MSNAYLLLIPGGPSTILIVLAILLLFGGKKIPELMKGLGKGIKEFKSATNDDEGTKSKGEVSDKKD